MAKYPRINNVQHVTDLNGECEACAKSATFVVRVEWDYMRGSDDTYRSCQRHADMAQNKLPRFLAHVGSKVSFVGAKP